jgi:putative ABC transport system permease protein
MSGLSQDLRVALRMFARRPGFTCAAILTLALGIGATVTLFSVVHGVLLEPLPWPDADRLVRLEETREGATRSWPWRVTNLVYQAWAEEPTTVEGLAAWRGSDTGTLTEVGEPMRLRYADVTASLFPLLGARALVGDLFTETDRVGGKALVLSEGLWEERFARDPEAIGRVVRLDGVPHTIVGVASRGLAFPDPDTRAWTLLEMLPVVEGDGLDLLYAMARLEPEATPPQAAQEATARAAHMPRPGPVEGAIFGTRGTPLVTATPFVEATTESVRPALLLLLAGAGLLLLAATANVAGLQLVAATVRRRELALRAAVGAGWGRLARLLLAENLLLGLAGGVGGLALAAAAQRALPVLLPADFPRLHEVSVDGPVAAFAAGLSIVASVGLGLLPALVARRLQLTEVLAEDGGGTVGVGRSGVARARALLLSGQVAVACVLLTSALQLSRSFVAQITAERGYDTDRVLVADLSLPEALYTPERRQALMTGLLGRLRAHPDVEQASFASVHPLSANEAIAAFRVRPGEEAPVRTSVRSVSPGYFETLGRRLLAGRFLDERDVDATQPALVVNRTFAERYLDQPAVGSHLPNWGEEPAWEVVGVVEDARPARLAAPPQPEAVWAVPWREGLRLRSLSLLVRTRPAPEAFVGTLRSLLREQDPPVVPERIRPMSGLLGDGLAQPRLNSLLVGVFAASALLIAGVGIFALLSYTVALRRREIGVRVALGARPSDVMRLVSRRAFVTAVSGLSLGLAGSFAGSKILRGFLYGVRPLDLVAVLAVATALAILTLGASVLPARQAARIDPHQALRDA